MRFVGHPVVAVVAETRAIARDALDLIEVDYQPLPVAVDIEKAAEPGAPKIYDEFVERLAAKLAGVVAIKNALLGGLSAGDWQPMHEFRSITMPHELPSYLCGG